MTYGHGFGMSVWFIFGWIITVVVIVFAIYGLMMLLRRSEYHHFVGNEKSVGDSIQPSSKESPLDILKSRLAKGEISREEYLVLKDDILNN